jgi:hypothetical protein
MVPYKNITTLRIPLRIRVVLKILKSDTPPANRLGGYLKIVRSTVERDTVFKHSPINKGNDVTPLG